jgi:hypothetical protein
MQPTSRRHTAGCRKQNGCVCAPQRQFPPPCTGTGGGTYPGHVLWHRHTPHCTSRQTHTGGTDSASSSRKSPPHHHSHTITRDRHTGSGVFSSCLRGTLHATTNVLQVPRACEPGWHCRGAVRRCNVCRDTPTHTPATGQRRAGLRVKGRDAHTRAAPCSSCSPRRGAQKRLRPTVLLQWRRRCHTAHCHRAEHGKARFFQGKYVGLCNTTHSSYIHQYLATVPPTPRTRVLQQATVPE